MGTIRAWWLRIGHWPKAVLLAAIVLVLLHTCVLRWVTVRSTSMYSTLLPGDLVGVQRWPVWTGFHRGDVVVFRDPMQDDRLMGRRDLLVKRIVGMPGDEVRIRKGVLFVNGEAMGYPGETRSHLVRLVRGTDPAPLLAELGLPPSFLPAPGPVIELPLTPDQRETLEARLEVLSAEPMSTASGAPRHIFPFSPYFKWNSDNYGPVRVPAEGDTVRIDVSTIPMFDRIIHLYEGHALEADRNDLVIDGVAADRYVIGQDYYFVLGDSRHYSGDSRYWGFVPADHLVGRAAFVVAGVDPDRGGLRKGRWWRPL